MGVGEADAFAGVGFDRKNADLEKVASGVFELSKLTSILGGLVAAIVTAQRAFPFGSRVQFYRVLVGQTENLITDVRTGAPLPTVATTLKSLRLDFAQQLPRGSSFNTDETEKK